MVLLQGEVSMTSNEHELKKRVVKGEEQTIRTLMNEWDPIPGSPADEYDCLVHHILGLLHQNAAKNQLRSMIQSELVCHFGLHPSNQEIDAITEKIWSYWYSGKRQPEIDA